ncbi:MAG: Prophage antirepressor [Parcubacteria group bacterium GW2011_GWA2_45_14]|nr:MAG: Prophage antirepressor [Parcubacteria group bacterium GW2011_GWA2_45_14]
MTDEITTKIALFKGKEIRKTLRNGEWWFVIVDVVAALTESANPAQYLKNIRNRDIEFDSLFNPVDKGGVQIDPPLALPFSTAGGTQNLLCWNTEGIFRLIQSIPSSKAEPFKRWLAKVGYERVQEIENPELATKRTRMLYKLKGRSDDWIEKRMRSIAIHEELTDEWKNRGAKDNNDYAILTAEISKATFGVTPSEYKKLKGLVRENLRDHMDDFELIFNMLGERATTEIHRTENTKGVPKLKADAKAGGDIAGGARRQLEKRLGKSIVSGKNYLKKPEDKKLLNK